MKYIIPKIYLFSLLTAFATNMAQPAFAADCGKATSTQSVTDRSWIKSDKPIYLAREGKIYVSQFNSEKLTLLAGHGFDYMSGFQMSPDSKHLIWSGGFFKSVEKFSIMDIGTHEIESIPFPLDVKKLHDFRALELSWSPDGNDIYLGFIAWPTQAALKYNLVFRKFSTIDGYYKSSGDFGFHYLEKGKELPVYRTPCLQWQCGGQGSFTPGETANIDSNHNLILKTPDGKTFNLDKGDSNRCEGETIRILSWLENGNYLIYTKSGSVYIYGIAEQKKTILFKISEVNFFGWEEKQNRRPSLFD